jgi:hypothetical protein
MKTSKTVQSKINELYAILATAAAKKAVAHVQDYDDTVGAQKWASTASNWLIKAGANAAQWSYDRPRAG